MLQKEEYPLHSGEPEERRKLTDPKWGRKSAIENDFRTGSRKTDDSLDVWHKKKDSNIIVCMLHC